MSVLVSALFHDSLKLQISPCHELELLALVRFRVTFMLLKIENISGY